MNANRTTVRFVCCPNCGAPLREPCKGLRGDRTTNHRERVDLFIAWRNRTFGKQKRR